MSTSPTATFLQHLRQWAAGRGEEPTSDRELLQRFSSQRDEDAFAALLRRHGPMVLSVCRRILHQAQDAEDAFQATFLVLLRRAATHSWRESIGGWLHGVATRIALHLRSDAARRTAEIPRTTESTVADPLEQMTARELLAAFDEELMRLPERYRTPLVLCGLQDKTQEETARQLGCSLSTIRRRLERGRHLLHLRLTRRGLELPAGLSVVLLAREASALVPPLLRASVGQILRGNVPARIAVLAESALPAAVLTPIKATAVVLLLGALTAGAGWTAANFLPSEPPPNETIANAPPDTPTTEKTERTDLYGDPLPPRALVRIGTVRFRAANCIGQIAYSPDGKTLAARDVNGKIFLFDTATGRKLRRLDTSTNPFFALAFAPDGKILAAAGSQAIQLWDLAAGKELRRFPINVQQAAHDFSLRRIAPLVFSHNGNELAWAAPDRSIRVWEVKTGKELVKLSGHREPIRCLAFSADDKNLVSMSGEIASAGSVRVWRRSDGKELGKFSPPIREPPLPTRSFYAFPPMAERLRSQPSKPWGRR